MEKPSAILGVAPPRLFAGDELLSDLAERSGLAAQGLRQGRQNPAQWKGNLAHILSAPSDLRARAGMAPRALEFAILTAARTGEVLGARWSEIDLNIPGFRAQAAFCGGLAWMMPGGA